MLLDETPNPLEPLQAFTDVRSKSPQSLDALVGVSLGFSSALLHDLRQPVSAILFNALAALRLLRKEEPREQAVIEDSLKDIVSEVDRLKTLLQGFGTYLGLGGDDIPGLDVNQTVTSAIGLLAGESVRRQIRLSMDLGNDLPPLLISPALLTRAMIMLTLDIFWILKKSPSDLRHIRVWTQQSQARVKIGFQFAAQALSEDESPSAQLQSQVQLCAGDLFVSKDSPEEITWGIELPCLSESGS